MQGFSSARARAEEIFHQPEKNEEELVISARNGTLIRRRRISVNANKVELDEGTLHRFGILDSDFLHRETGLQVEITSNTATQVQQAIETPNPTNSDKKAITISEVQDYEGLPEDTKEVSIDTILKIYREIKPGLLKELIKAILDKVYPRFPVDIARLKKIRQQVPPDSGIKIIDDHEKIEEIIAKNKAGRITPEQALSQIFEIAN